MNKEVISISDTSSSEDIKTENKENANILEDRYKEEIVLLKNTIKTTEEFLSSEQSSNKI